jgi:beta-mannanase
MENTLKMIKDNETILFVSYNEFVHKIIKAINKEKNNVTVYLLANEIDSI